LPTPAESDADGPFPGIVRRFWWRTSHRTRLAIMCLGVLTALATTVAAGFAGDGLPREHRSTGPEAAVHRGDSFEVTVRTVSDVDLFEGVESATGLSFHARVAGVHRVAECRLDESREVAQNLLRGKKVRLTVKKDDLPGSDRTAVDVQLPDGADYAQTIVHDGVATADLSTRGELASVEAAARLDRRGLWAAACAPGQVTPTPYSTPTSSTAPEPESSAEPPPPPVTSTSSPPPADGGFEFRLGKPCFVEGARWTAPNGDQRICARNAKNQLRWRRAD
jgi:endonuclease YncB( thermonuclease family)